MTKKHNCYGRFLFWALLLVEIIRGIILSRLNPALFFKILNQGSKWVFVNNQLDAQYFFMYVYFYFLHVSGTHVSIIRRINCINTTYGICHCVQMTVWCAGLDELGWVSSKLAHQTAICIEWHTRCIDTINSPDDGHIAARNM